MNHSEIHGWLPLSRSLCIVFGMLLSPMAVAIPDHVYEFTYDGNITTFDQSAAGSVISIGETVGASFNASVNDHWTVGAGEFIWTPIAVNSSGERTGDLSWSFYRNGVEVDAGSLLAGVSKFNHIPKMIKTSVAMTFDELYWEYTLTSSTATSNILASLLLGLDGGSLSPAEYVAGNAVPEPSTLPILSLALVGLGIVRRRIR